VFFATKSTKTKYKTQPTKSRKFIKNLRLFSCPKPKGEPKMSKIIIEKNNNPSAEKYYLTDEKLTLKAKGLLTQLFAIPENQHFTIEALKHLSQDGIKSIRSATKELENTGYLTRHQPRTKTGQLKPTEFTIHKMPQKRPKTTRNSKNKTTVTQNKKVSNQLDIILDVLYETLLELDN